MFSIGAALTAAAWQDAPVVTDAAPLVYVAEVDSIIHPVSAEYMIDTMDRADRNGATLVVFTLRTPGGLVDSTRDIVSHMIAAKTPVAVFVAPSGARAASAGFILTIAADVARHGAGHAHRRGAPGDGSGEKMDETTAKKADGGRGRLRAHAGEPSPPERDARRSGGDARAAPSPKRRRSARRRR